MHVKASASLTSVPSHTHGKLRLWADVFRVHGDGEYMRWERVSDDVVPVNISCIEDTPTTVFHVTAYNRQVEKIFDVCISQPGESGTERDKEEKGKGGREISYA
ncbi:polyprotein [Plakobranchus ocellatus]|uniref:Polyprotein n=1 Tax=Plakobranchus ocellatus TaxID=259542 RepID=A0AAV4C5S9_9GAST|nr:polyprotein [Plakobranchus ocellatus]